MPQPGPNLAIDGARLWDSLGQMALIGPGIAGGCNRQALTDADGQGRALFADWCAQAGLDLRIDPMGTMVATRPGTEALPAVWIGSHLDTQPTGGRYDGVLGVLGALEIVRTLNDLGLRTRHPISIVNWTNEEGTRFAPAMLASGVVAGVHGLDWALDRTDAAGLRFGDELARIGWQGDAAIAADQIHAFFELHIEQGPILEAEGLPIGIVTHGQGLRWIEVILTGREAHTGSTPMALRRNAGLGLARITTAVHDIAMAHQPGAVGAIGHVEVYPNSRNIIPGRVVFTIDIRSPDLATLTAMEGRVRAAIAATAAELGLEAQVALSGAFDPVTFDPGCVATLRAAADRLGLAHRDIVSGAGHDACWINRIAPTAMVFCPCEGGLSHNEAEAITPEWATQGTNVLLHAVLETAGLVD